MKRKKEIEDKIDKNRDKIQRWLQSDAPMDLVYEQVRILSIRNGQLLETLKLLSQ